MERRRVLILMGRYLPGYKDGGPVRTIANLVDTFHEKIDFKIVTSDRDHNETEPYANILHHEWNKVGNAMVYYVPPNGLRFSLLRKLAEDTHVIYCCGPYNNYSIKMMILKKVKLINKPVILASMGSFSQGAYNIKGFKKRLFVNLFKYLGLFSSLIWSVTSTIEKKQVQEIIGKDAKCYIAEDLPRQFPNEIKVKCKEPGTLKIVFISRISKSKNLDYAIEIISGLKGNIDFVIYGTQEDKGYWNKCIRLLNALPNSISWRYEGEADSEKIIDIFSQYDIFLFPTLGENYGHVIYEALAAGCIPVISNTTPWLDFNEMKCGNVIPLNDVNRFIEVLEAYVAMDEADINKISENAYEYAKQKYSEAVQTSGYLHLFTDL